MKAALIGLAAAATLLAAGGEAAAQRQRLFPNVPSTGPRAPIDPKGEFLLRADEVVYDRESEIVTATGRVEASQGERVLLADTISYNRRTEVVTASGNISLMEPTGEVIFGDYVELSDDMRNGFIRNVRVLLVDNSRIAAAGARRTDGNRKEMTRAVFSPCNLCQEDPTRAPLWQVKGVQVTHDEEKHDVIYEDATLELFGVPVFYTPYFAHPDPSVKRRSGFLAPSLGQSENYGFMFGAPYFGILSESSDITVEPRLYSDEGGMLLTEYRQRFTNGALRFAGSILNGREVDGTIIRDDRTWRGNVAAEGRWDIDDNWRGGFDLARTTDRTYMRRFRVGDGYRSRGRYSLPNQLTSDVWAEGFFDRSYAQASAFAFQTLRANESSRTIPKVHPFAEYSYVSPTDSLGGYFRADSNMLSLSRQQGADSNRISNFTGYYLPWIGSGGSVWQLSATVQSDAYSVSDVQLPGTTQTYDGFTGRIHPQVAALWRYPMISRQENTALVVEPIVGVVVGPSGNNPRKIPNEDSRGFEFDETNLFSLRRFSGFDRVSSGQRVDYGLSAGVYGVGGGSTSAFIGQSVRAQKDSTYPVGSGLEDYVSDIVGRLSVRPLKMIDLSYRFRLDKEELATSRDEFSVTYFQGRSSASVSYIQFDQSTAAATGQPFETISVSGTVPISDYWSAYGIYNRDLQRNESIKAVAGVLYRDECFALLLTYEQDFQNDRDIRSGATFMVRLGFKYLGDIGG